MTMNIYTHKIWILVIYDDLSCSFILFLNCNFHNLFLFTDIYLFGIITYLINKLEHLVLSGNNTHTNEDHNVQVIVELLP